MAIAVSTLIATPFTIRELGPHDYGLWSLLGVTVTYIALADLGMTQSSTRFAGAAVATNDLDQERVVIWSIRRHVDAHGTHLGTRSNICAVYSYASYKSA